MGLFDRIRDGPVVDAGDWEDAVSEYTNELYNETGVDVTVSRSYGPPTGGGMKMDEVAEEDVMGREALETAEEYIADDAFGDMEMEDLPFEYEHRSRGDMDVLSLEGGYSFIGHQNVYRVRFEF